MKLSFVIPAYNEENFIGNCLRAILARTTGSGFDTEIIVVNNASTDRTGEIARSFPGVIVVDEPRKGLSQARQSGFLASSGDLVANIDADTKLPKGWLETVFKEFTSKPDLIGLSGPQIFYDASAWDNFLVKVYYFIAYPFYFRFLQGGNFIIRRKALEKIGGYDTQFTFYGEDTDITRRLNKIGKVRFTFKLSIPASGRRVAAEGRITMFVRYVLNYFWTMLFRKPYTQDSTSIRSNEKKKMSPKKRILYTFTFIFMLLLLGGTGIVGYILGSGEHQDLAFVNLAQAKAPRIVRFFHSVYNEFKDNDN